MRGKSVPLTYIGTVNRNVKRLAEDAGLRPRKLDRLAGLKVGTTERVIAGKRKVYADEGRRAGGVPKVCGESRGNPGRGPGKR